MSKTQTTVLACVYSMAKKVIINWKTALTALTLRPLGSL